MRRVSCPAPQQRRLSVYVGRECLQIRGDKVTLIPEPTYWPGPADSPTSQGTLAYECTSSPPLACHSRTKLLASSSEHGLTPIRIPPARIPCSYSSMRPLGMPH